MTLTPVLIIEVHKSTSVFAANEHHGQCDGLSKKKKSRFKIFILFFFRLDIPIVLSYNYYVNKQSTQLRIYRLVRHVSNFKKVIMSPKYLL